MTEIKFAKLRENAVIPSKDDENAGYDIYPAFENDLSYFMIKPNQTRMIPTGICSAFSEDYVMVLKERGSTGTKGIGQRSGIIDSGYRGEWFVPITNHNDKNLVILNIDQKEYEDIIDDILEQYSGSNKDFGLNNVIFYPRGKAIAQAILLPVPRAEIVECTPEEITAVPSKRGDGALGSSGK